MILPVGFTGEPTVLTLDAENLPARAKAVQRSYNVGGRTIYPNVYLAPMSGVTDRAFRRLISRLAGGRTGLLVSEFVSVEGLRHMNPKSCREMDFTEEERPFTVQIFGGEPEKMAWGARKVEESGADFVEINCGCPVPRVVKKGGGSGLLRDTENLARILRAVKGAVGIPVTVKVRIGWDDDSINLAETQRIIEGEGADALVIHGRTRLQGYKGLANWEVMAEAKARATIPVIGNGDILSVADVLHKLETYKVDGVAVGRGAMHNPWLFAQIADVYEGKEPREPSLDEQIEFFHAYRDLLFEETEYEGRVLGKLKQTSARLMKCLPGATLGRLNLLRSPSLSEFFNNLEIFYRGMAENYSGRKLDSVRELNGKDQAEVVFGNDYKR